MRDEVLFAALGLEPGVPSAEIKRAYRNLTLRFHPDASRNPATARRFQRVSRAYKSLNAAPSKDIRPRLAAALAPLARSLDLFELGTRLAGSGDPSERAEAARHLGLSGKRSAWLFLRKGLSDPDPRVVAACVRSAAALGLSQGAGELASVYARSGAEVRDAILETARATGDGILALAVEAACSDENLDRRLLAMRIKLDASRRADDQRAEL